MPYAENAGVRIRYEVYGSGPTLVLQHGFTQSIEDWIECGCMAALAPKYRVIPIDARGHGLSDKPLDEREHALEHRARDVTAVLDATGTKQAGFWGYSMGCIRGSGKTATFGWPDIPRLEELRNAWFDATDEAAQAAICREMQVVAVETVPCAPAGIFYQPTAYSKTLTDVPRGVAQFRECAVSEAADWDQPVRYIERTHAWYDALGYGNPYRYAHYADVPFTPLAKPLTACRIALLTTAAPWQPDKGDQSAKAPYNAAAKFYAVYSGDSAVDHDLRVSHVGVDRAELQDDPNCWFPLPALRRAAGAERIGGLTVRFHGVPTNRSQRHTIETDAPESVRRCREDGADAAILVPNCPVCHQTMSLVARALEQDGIPTVVMGAAKDIVELCGVPRFLFSDFPLGNAAGRPFDTASQDGTLALALRVLESAPAARTTVQNPLRWDASAQWKVNYLNLDRLTPEELARRRAQNDVIKEVARGVRETTLSGGA